MTIAQAFNEIAVAQGGTAAKSGNIASAIDALNDALAGSDQKAATTIEGAVRLLGEHIGSGGGVAPSGTISITENGEGIDVAQYAYADVNVSGGGGTSTHKVYVILPETPETRPNVNVYKQTVSGYDETVSTAQEVLELQGEGETITFYASTFEAADGWNYEIYYLSDIQDYFVSGIEYTNISPYSENRNGHIYFTAPNYDAVVGLMRAS